MIISCYSHLKEQLTILISNLYQQQIRKMIIRHQLNPSHNRQEITRENSISNNRMNNKKNIKTVHHLQRVRCIITSTITIITITTIATTTTTPKYRARQASMKTTTTTTTTITMNQTSAQ